MTKRSKKNEYVIGILMMLVSASLATFGQMFWKFGANALPMGLFTLDALGNVVLGCVLYASGSLTMMYALRKGEVSVLHPVMSFSYVLSQIIGAIVFHDPLTAGRSIGVVLIAIGIVVLMRSGSTKEEKNA